MLFKKSYGDLVQEALGYLEANTNITNTSAGGITRSLIEVINKNISDYYDILDVNMAMGFLSTSEGYFLDLIGSLFSVTRLRATTASVATSDNVQRFYVTTGTLHDRIPTDTIASGTKVTSNDGTVSYSVATDTVFDVGASSVYVPITADGTGTKYNVGKNALITHSLGLADVYTANDKAIVSGTDTEADSNYKYRIANATLSAEKANETAIRLAALSVGGVANVIMRPWTRGIGTYDVMVVPAEGIATNALVASVQAAIDSVQAYGIDGEAKAPTVVPVDLTIKLVFTNNTTDHDKDTIRINVRNAIEEYIVNIPIGGTFIVNELRQQIMDVSTKIRDHTISCYYFRDEPCFLSNIDIYWDEMFYPNPDSYEAITVI